MTARNFIRLDEQVLSIIKTHWGMQNLLNTKKSTDTVSSKLQNVLHHLVKPEPEHDKGQWPLWAREQKVMKPHHA